MRCTKEMPKFSAGGEQGPPDVSSEEEEAIWKLRIEEDERGGPRTDPKGCRYGEEVDEKDPSRNWWCCPVCGRTATKSHTSVDNLDWTSMSCGRNGKKGHEWWYDRKTKIIERVDQPELPFSA